MRIRLGYVAIALNVKDGSPSRTVTAANLAKIETEEGRRIRARKIAGENLLNTLRILKYNLAHDIMVYRLTSKLVPLATHPILEGWDYISDLKEDFKEVGEFIRQNGLRVSSHPDHFTLLNSPKEEVTEASLKDLDYHEKVYLAMGLDERAKMVIHTGGLYGDKEGSIARFIKNFDKLPRSLKNRIILENDDKIYNAEDVLNICKTLGIPMALDIHHDWCNKSPHEVSYYLEDIFNTWKGTGLTPKIHVSSPKDEKHIRNHADYVNPEDFMRFLNIAREIDRDFDVMIEAKQKDIALLKLMEDLKSYDGIKPINGGEILY